MARPSIGPSVGGELELEGSLGEAVLPPRRVETTSEALRSDEPDTSGRSELRATEVVAQRDEVDEVIRMEVTDRDRRQR